LRNFCSKNRTGCQERSEVIQIILQNTIHPSIHPSNDQTPSTHPTQPKPHMANTTADSIGNEVPVLSVPQRTYLLMKLEIFDSENNLSMVLPCPNCFIVQTTTTSVHICPGCVAVYNNGHLGCTALFEDQEEFGQEKKCYCTATFGKHKARHGTCMFNSTFDQYVKDNSAFYTESQVKTMWPLVAFDSLIAGDRVVGISSVHSDNGEGTLCLNCYGHHFPCSSTCDPLHYGVMTYGKCKEGHIAGKMLPTTYEEFAKLKQHHIDHLVSMAWEQLDLEE